MAASQTNLAPGDFPIQPWFVTTPAVRNLARAPAELHASTLVLSAGCRMSWPFLHRLLVKVSLIPACACVMLVMLLASSVLPFLVRIFQLRSQPANLQKQLVCESHVPSLFFLLA